MISYHYARYTSDGAILSVQTCTFEIHPVPDGMCSVPPGTNDIEHFIDVATGEVRTYPPEAASARRAWPGPGHEWSVTAGAWIDVRSIDDVRQAAWARVKSARDHAMAADLDLGGSRYQADEVSRLAIAAAARIALAEPQYRDIWTTADNGVVELTAEDLIALDAALVARASAAHATARRLRAIIEHPDTTREQLMSLAWPA